MLPTFDDGVALQVRPLRRLVLALELVGSLARAEIAVRCLEELARRLRVACVLLAIVVSPLPSTIAFTRARILPT